MSASTTAASYHVLVILYHLSPKELESPGDRHIIRVPLGYVPLSRGEVAGHQTKCRVGEIQPNANTALVPA